MSDQNRGQFESVRTITDRITGQELASARIGNALSLESHSDSAEFGHFCTLWTVIRHDMLPFRGFGRIGENSNPFPVLTSEFLRIPLLWRSTVKSFRAMAAMFLQVSSRRRRLTTANG